MTKINFRKLNLKHVAIILLSQLAVFVFNQNAFAFSDASQKTDSGFGSASKSETDAWIEGSVRQVNGVWVIHSNGENSNLNPDDFGGKGSFIWRALIAGGQMTKERIRQLATAVVEKYLLNIDNWPEVMAVLQSWGITSANELESLQTIFENSSPSYADLTSLQEIFDISVTLPTGQKILPSKASQDPVSIAGEYSDDEKRIVTETVSYKYAHLIDPKTKKAIPSWEIEENPLSYRRVYKGTDSGNNPVIIFGDKDRLIQVDEAMQLVNDPTKKYLIKNTPYVKNYNADGYIFNCMNYSDETYELLVENGIDAYIVSFNEHMANAIKTGEVIYPDGNIYSTYAVLEPKTGEIMGQLGWVGTQVDETYPHFNKNLKITDAVVLKDYVFEKREYQTAVSTTTKIATYTASQDIAIDDDAYLRVDNVGGVATTGLPQSRSIPTDAQRIKTNLVNNYAPGIASGEYAITFCSADRSMCAKPDIKSVDGVSYAVDTTLDYYDYMATVAITDNGGNTIYYHNFAQE